MPFGLRLETVGPAMHGRVTRLLFATQVAVCGPACNGPVNQSREDLVAAVGQAPSEAGSTPPAGRGGRLTPSDEQATSETTTDTTGSTADHPAEPIDPLQGTIAPGDNLSKLVQRAGLGPAVSLQIAAALTPIVDPAALAIGQQYAFALADDGSLQRFQLQLSRTRSVRVEQSEDGKLTAREEQAETTTREVELGLRIEGSLWAAMEKAGIEPSLIDRVVDVFAYDINFFTETRVGDTIRVVVARIELDEEFVEWGRVLAAEYAGQLGTHRVYWWEPSKGEARYVNAEGQGVTRTLLKTPLRFARVSSAFNPKRMHPVLHRVKGHNGVDFAAPTGTPIMAAADGTIVSRGPQGGAGNMVVLAHGNGMRTLYMHMSRFADGQKVGTRVKAKDVIGYVGASGLATGPHLHFGLTVNGRYVDPQKVKQTRHAGVASRDRSRWNRVRRGLDDRLEGVLVRDPAGAGGEQLVGDEALASDVLATSDKIEVINDEVVASD